VEVGERLGEGRKSACERKKEMEIVASKKECVYYNGLLDPCNNQSQIISYL